VKGRSVLFFDKERESPERDGSGGQKVLGWRFFQEDCRKTESPRVGKATFLNSGKNTGGGLKIAKVFVGGKRKYFTWGAESKSSDKGMFFKE